MISLQTTSGLMIEIDLDHSDPTAASTVTIAGQQVYCGPLEHDHEEPFSFPYDGVTLRGRVTIYGSGPSMKLEVYSVGSVVVKRDGSTSLNGGLKHA